MIKIWQIWSEGYTDMGDSYGLANKLGEVEAESFQKACDIWFNRPENAEFKKTYQANGLYSWGCKLHDNEEGARQYERTTIFPVIGWPSKWPELYWTDMPEDYQTLVKAVASELGVHPSNVHSQVQRVAIDAQCDTLEQQNALAIKQLWHEYDCAMAARPPLRPKKVNPEMTRLLEARSNRG